MHAQLARRVGARLFGGPIGTIARGASGEEEHE